MRNQIVLDLTPINIAGSSRSYGMGVFRFAGILAQRFSLQSSPGLINSADESLLVFLDSTGTLLWVTETGTNAPPTQFYRTRLVS